MKMLVAVTVLCVGMTACGTPAGAQTLTQRLRSESAAKLAAHAREKGDAVRGAILFTQQNLACTRCHAPADATALGPDLTQLGSEATDVYLVESLLEPSKVIRKGFESAVVVTKAGKTVLGRIVEEDGEFLTVRGASVDSQPVKLAKGDIEEVAPSKLSAMPDNLVDQLKDRDQFLDLARYLFELASAPRTRARSALVRGGGQVVAELQGLALIEQWNCSACHENDLSNAAVTVKQAPKLSWGAGRIDPHYIERFLADPATTKPGTTMPDLLAGRNEEQRKLAAAELTQYVVSLGERAFELQPIDREAATRGRELFHSVGCVACHSPRDEAGQELLPDRSVPLGSVGQKYNRDGLVDLLKNPHEVRPSGRMPNMRLTHWEAVDIASYLLASSGTNGTAGEPFQRNAKLATKGKQQFERLGCARCHATMNSPAPESPGALPLSRVRPTRGCLSNESGGWPRFDLQPEQRQAIQAALSRTPGALSDNEQISVTLTALRCLNCHQRGELGGVSTERNSYFQTSNPNLGPQGRIPPTLTGVGAKLNAKWMRQVLVGGRAIRPYVTTRMPQYGADNVAHLVELFPRVDELPEIEHATFSDLKEMRNIGAELVGTGGLNCIACHTFQLKQAANMPAVDLTEMAERLRKEWFYHYMRDPQRLSANTVMPSFWPGGRAIRRDILDGDTNLQIEALWQYLLDGRQARTPRGLIREPLELLATDEAVMLRRSYPGIGKRGIGVGYPLLVNIAFDAEQMRLATIWKGRFADPSGVWLSQGHGMVRPLGNQLVQFPKGPELDDPQSPWIADDGRPPRHRFKGYTLDDKQRPTFTYQFGDITVQDYPVDVLDVNTQQPILRRRLTLSTADGQRKAVFRAAEGKTVEDAGDGVFVIDNSLTIRVDDRHDGTIVDTPTGRQLHIPVNVSRSATTLVLEYVW